MDNLWDKDERRMYRKLFKEYKREGCSNEEARMYAKQDCKNSIGLDIDSAERLYKDILKDSFDIMKKFIKIFNYIYNIINNYIIKYNN